MDDTVAKYFLLTFSKSCNKGKIFTIFSNDPEHECMYEMSNVLGFCVTSCILVLISGEIGYVYALFISFMLARVLTC